MIPVGREECTKQTETSHLAQEPSVLGSSAGISGDEDIPGSETKLPAFLPMLAAGGRRGQGWRSRSRLRNAAVGGTEADAGRGWRAGREHGRDIHKDRHLANSVWHLPIATPCKVRPGDGVSKGTPQLSLTDGPRSIRGAPTWVTGAWPAGGDL